MARRERAVTVTLSSFRVLLDRGTRHAIGTSSMKSGRSLKRCTLVGIASALIAVAALTTSVPPSAAAYGPPGAPQPNPAFAVPLAGSITTKSTVWATVVMGKNNKNFDLFWELLVLDPTTGQFRLVTPPGVADNGGLMIAPDAAGTAMLVGFGASQDLTFSPLALSTDSGRSWTQGGLPAPLIGAPSVIGFGTGGTVVALVGGSSPAVLARAGSLTSWKSLVTKDALGKTPAGKTCMIGSLQAVTFDPSGTPLVGASCREPYTPGIFVDSDRQWHLADVPVPNALAADVFVTLRLDGDSALLAAVHGKGTNLIVTWEQAPNRPWVLSPPLPLASVTDLLASGTGPGTTEFAVVRDGKVVRAEVVDGPGAAWRALPPLPTGTATIAIAPTGQVDALVVADTKLSAWRLQAKNEGWTKVQTITVPIVFGSSS